MTDKSATIRHGRADVVRCISTGAFATLWLFLLCWAAVAVALRVPVTHGFAALFTTQPSGSLSALGMGALWAFIGGAVAGAFVAHCYNLAGRFLGR